MSILIAVLDVRITQNQTKPTIRKGESAMNTIVCPKCSFENKGSRSICFNCGENLAGGRIIVKDQASSSFGGTAPQSLAPSREAAARSGGTAPSPKMRFTNKYSALKAIADLCNTIASIMAILAGIVGFVGLINLFRDGGFILGLALILFAAVFGVSGYIIYKILAEAIFVILDIEMNTRQTAAYTKHIMDNQ
jgi:hypothetical protein